jgi:hypothetical protein
MADESWVDLTREWSPARPPAGGPLGELPDYLAMLREAQGETSCRWPQPLNSSARSSILLDRTVVLTSTNRPSLGSTCKHRVSPILTRRPSTSCDEEVAGILLDRGSGTLVRCTALSAVGITALQTEADWAGLQARCLDPDWEGEVASPR